MKLIQILCKRTCEALIAGRRSAAPAAPGAAPATKASRGNTREDGPTAHPLRLWESGDWTSRVAVQSAQEKIEVTAGFLYYNRKVGALCSICHIHFITKVPIYLFPLPPFLETSSYQMSMNALTLMKSVLTNQELKEKVEFWPTVGDSSEVM